MTDRVRRLAATLRQASSVDLRYTAASWLVMRGRSLKEVQELLGHRTFTMTLRCAHLSADRLRDAVASLDGFSTKSAQSDTIDAERRVSP